HQATYLDTCSLLASDSSLDLSVRQEYCNQLLSSSSDVQSGEPVLLALEPALHLDAIRFCPASARVALHGPLSIQLQLVSHLPGPITADSLTLALHLEHTTTKPEELPVDGDPDGWLRLTEASGDRALGDRQLPLLLDFCEVHERGAQPDSPLTTSGVTYRNAHLFLRRQDSSSSPSRAREPVIEDTTRTSVACNVLLQPGNNTVSLPTLVREPGLFTLRQLCVQIGPLQLLSLRLQPLLQYTVYSQEPQLDVISGDDLLAGVPQELQVQLLTGHRALQEGEGLHISLPESLLLLDSVKIPARVESDSKNELPDIELSLELSPRLLRVRFPAVSGYHSVRFSLHVLCQPPTAIPPADDFDYHSIQEGVELKGLVVEHRVSIDSPWSIYSTLVTLTFHVPFRVQHTVLTSGHRKFVQVCVRNTCSLHFTLSQPSLGFTTEGEDTTLESLNPATTTCVCAEKEAWFLWEINGQPPSPVPCRFTVAFQLGRTVEQKCPVIRKGDPNEEMSDDGEEGKPPRDCLFNYEFMLVQLATLYSVQAAVMPPLGQEMCQMGLLCSLEVSITRLCKDDPRQEGSGSPTSDWGEIPGAANVQCSQLLYQVVDNSSNWAVCGRSSGLVAMPLTERAMHKLHLEVLPLFAGYLPLPDVHLSKYLSESATDESCGEPSRTPGVESSCTTTPRLSQFDPGEVYNVSRATQVLVLPSPDTSLVDITVP
uniref:Trafficking protein particle complex subunit 10 n=1 Tax=Eptatretus burgeri TaxID=7764 RepID=A0A8C4QTW0_EPTBU